MSINIISNNSQIKQLLNEDIPSVELIQKKTVQVLNGLINDIVVRSVTSQAGNNVDKPRLSPPSSTQSFNKNENLTYLMAMIAQLIDASNGDVTAASAELNQKLSEGAVQNAKTKAHEYEIQVKKAEQVHKAMGVFGKILGWVVAVVGFVCAAFTGGAALVIATAGLGLALGDEIQQDVTGGSFLQSAMKPIMDSVIMPLVKITSQVCTDVFEELGVPKRAAEIIGQILGPIVATVLLIGGVILAGKIGNKMCGNLMGDIMKKVMDSTIIKKIQGGVGGMAGMDEFKAAVYAERSKIAFAIGQPVHSAVNSTGEILTSDSMLKAAKIKSALNTNAALQEVLSNLVTMSTEFNTKNMQALNVILQNISATAQSQMQLGSYVSKQIGYVA